MLYNLLTEQQSKLFKKCCYFNVNFPSKIDIIKSIMCYIGKKHNTH